MTSAECTVCRIACAVGFECATRINGKWRHWRECVRCWLEDSGVRLLDLADQQQAITVNA